MATPQEQDYADRFGGLERAAPQASWSSGASASFSESWRTGVLSSLYRASVLASAKAVEEPGLGGEFGMQEATSRRLNKRMVSADDARALAKSAGVSVDFGDADYTQDAVQIMIDEAVLRKQREQTISSSGIGLGSQIALGLGAGLADPLNVALAFTPAAPASLTARIASATTAAGRAAARVSVGAVEGAAGAALVEPLIAGTERYYGADYTVANSLTNIALGSVLGAVAHPVLGVVADRVRAPRGDPLTEVFDVPPAPPAIAVGDLVNIVTGEERLLATPAPVRVTRIVDDPVHGTYGFIEGSNSGFPLKDFVRAETPAPTVDYASLPRSETPREADLPPAPKTVEIKQEQPTTPKKTERELALEAFQGDEKRSRFISKFDDEKKKDAMRQIFDKLEGIRRLIDEEHPNIAKTRRYYIDALYDQIKKFEISKTNFVTYIETMQKHGFARIIDEQTGKDFKFSVRRLDESAPGTFIVFKDATTPRGAGQTTTTPFEKDVLRDRELLRAQRDKPAILTPDTTTAAIDDTTHAEALLVAKRDFAEGRPVEVGEIITTSLSERELLVSQQLVRGGPPLDNTPARVSWWQERLKQASDRRKKNAAQKAETEYTARMLSEAGVKPKTVHAKAAARIAAYEREVLLAEKTSSDLEQDASFLEQMTKKEGVEIPEEALAEHNAEKATIQKELADDVTAIDTYMQCLLGDDDD